MAGPAATHEYMLYLPSTRHLSNLSDLKWRFGLLWPKCPAIRFLPWLFGFKYIMETYCYVKSLAFRSLPLHSGFRNQTRRISSLYYFFVSLLWRQKVPSIMFFCFAFQVLEITHNEWVPCIRFFASALRQKKYYWNLFLCHILCITFFVPPFWVQKHYCFFWPST